MRFHLFLPENLAKKLITLAEKEDRDPRQQAVWLLRRAIERAAQKKEPEKEYACVNEA